jgi:hypothetical protein
VKRRSKVQKKIDSARRHYTDKRKNFTDETRELLHTWFEEHRSHPYPTPEEKQALAEAGDIRFGFPSPSPSPSC